MKSKQLVKYMILPLCLSMLLLSGCQTKKNEEASSTKTEVTATPSATPTTTETPTELPSGGEGSNLSTPGETLSNENAIVKNIGETVVFQKDGQDLYSLTVDSIELTEERNQYSAATPNRVVDIRYTYKNISSTAPIFIDDFKFKLADSQKSACTLYPFDTELQAMPAEIGAEYTVQISYELNTDGSEVSLYYTDDITGNNEEFVFAKTFL